jgi:putative membrane protein
MIRRYNKHAANEWTFLAWVRTGLSAVALGIVVKKGSLVAALAASAHASDLSSSAQGYLSNFGGSALITLGIAAMAAAAFRFVRTAYRIDDRCTHSPGIVRLASALLRLWREHSKSAEHVSANDALPPDSKRNRLFRKVKQINLKLVGGTDIGGIS